MKKNLWFKCLAKMTAALSFVAVVASAAPCVGQYYQPEVPESLRR